MNQSMKKKLAIIFTVILAFWMLASGLNKLMITENVLTAFERWSLPRWLIFPVGALEATAAVCLFIPKIRNYAKAMIILLMAAAVATHIRSGENFAVLVPLAVIILTVAALLFRYQSHEHDG